MAIRSGLANTWWPAAWLLAVPLLAAGQSRSPATRLETLKAKGLSAQITVFPVRVAGRATPEVAEVLALLVEQGGMQNMEWTTQVVPRAAEAAFDNLSVEFGDYVRRGAIPTEYALYAELLGTPGVGVSAAFSSTCCLPV